MTKKIIPQFREDCQAIVNDDYPLLTVVCIPPGCFDWPLLQDDELLEVHDHVHGQERSHPIPSPVLIQIRRIRRHGRRRRRRQIRRLHLLHTPELYQ